MSPPGRIDRAQLTRAAEPSLGGAIGITLVNFRWAEFSILETIAGATVFRIGSVWARQRQLKNRTRLTAGTP
jgi:hypothetical protein